MRFFNFIARFFVGKNIVILGSKATGKTTLQTFLRKGELVTEYEETQKEKLPGGTFQFKDYKFHVSKGHDIGGDESFYEQWEQLILKCDYCFYLFDSSEIYNGNQYAIDYINEYLPYVENLVNKNKKKFLVIGNFTDKIKNFSKTDKKIMNLLKLNLEVALDNSNLSINKILFGNMSNEENIIKLIKKIIILLKDV